MASEEELVRENILGCLQATLLPAPLSVALRSSSVVSRLNSNHSGGLCLRCRTSNRMSESPGVRLCRSGVRRENVPLGEVDAGAELVVDHALSRSSSRLGVKKTPLPASVPCRSR